MAFSWPNGTYTLNCTNIGTNKLKHSIGTIPAETLYQMCVVGSCLYTDGRGTVASKISGVTYDSNFIYLDTEDNLSDGEYRIYSGQAPGDFS